MATQKQRQTAKRNVKKAQAGARRKKTITTLSSKTRSALGREGAKAAARKRGASKGTGSGAGARDRIRIRISRPGETESQGIKVPVVFEHSPYRGDLGGLPNHPVDVDRMPQEDAGGSDRATAARRTATSA